MKMVDNSRILSTAITNFSSLTSSPSSALSSTATSFLSSSSSHLSFNESSASTDNEATDQWKLVVIGICLSLLILLAVSGNVLVCVAVFTDRNLRKIGNLYIVSLSLADLTLACLVMTFALTNDLLGHWPFGQRFCDTWIAFDVLCSTASILNLCAISLDRYIHIKDPLRYGRSMTKRVVLSSICSIWLTAALISFVPIFLGVHRRADTSHATPFDQLPQCALELTPLYAVVSSCISFYAPCVVMLAIYSRLYLYARKHVRSIRSLSRPVLMGAIDGVTSTAPVCPHSHVVSESKAATTVGIIVGVFLVCYLPFFCVNIAASFCNACVSMQLFQTLTWFGYSNSSFNPIIYSIFNVEFRDAFSRILAKVRVLCVRSCRIRRRSDRRRRQTGLSARSRRSTGVSKLSVAAQAATVERTPSPHPPDRPPISASGNCASTDRVVGNHCARVSFQHSHDQSDHHKQQQDELQNPLTGSVAISLDGGKASEASPLTLKCVERVTSI